MLGVVISSDFSLEKHASNVSATGFHNLRQLRRIRRSVNRDSAATLVHVFVTSRVDYCNAVFAAAPKFTTNKLQRVLNATARVVTGTRKIDCGLSHMIYSALGVSAIMRYINRRLLTYLLTDELLKGHCTTLEVAADWHWRCKLAAAPCPRQRTLDPQLCSQTDVLCSSQSH